MNDTSPCPFCAIAAAYPAPLSSAQPTLAASVPTAANAHPERISPSAFVVLASRDVVAFLDILPMTAGHLLVATRGHFGLVGDVEGEVAREVGGFFSLSVKFSSKTIILK
jgi:diadenosine tetraphosphate (Ap4A) HIT family hydrolase